MKFIITVNVETAESESASHTPIGTIILTALPLILDSLGIKPPVVSDSDTISPPPSDSPHPSESTL